MLSGAVHFSVAESGHVLKPNAAPEEVVNPVLISDIGEPSKPDYIYVFIKVITAFFYSSVIFVRTFYAVVSPVVSALTVRTRAARVANFIYE